MRTSLALASLSLIFAIGVSGAPAFAQVSTDEAKCRAFIAKSVGKYVKKAQKTIAKCHKLRNKGKHLAITDCNSLAVADFKTKLVGLEGKFTAKILDQCSDTGGPLNDVLAEYATCHSPGQTADDGGATTDIDDFVEVASCLVAMARGLTESNARQILGLPDPAAVQALGSTGAKCHAEVAKRSVKLVDTTAKERGKCQKASDAGGGPLDYVCAGMDPSTKIAGALTKLKDGINVRCAGLTPVDMNVLDLCGDTPDQLKSCAGDRIASLVGGGLVAMAYNLDSCPRGIDLTMRASNCSQVTSTDWDIGSSGSGHDADVNDASFASMELTCNSSCSACTATQRASDNCRCENDPTIICDVVNGPDAVNCGGFDCQCFAGPPQAVSAGNVPLCIVRQTSSVAGTVNAGTGQVDLTAELATRVHLGINILQPCPLCVGDPTANDGTRGGTCSGGSRNGLACDENSSGCPFGPVSHDCPPDPGFNVSGGGASILLDPLTDGTVSESAGLTGAFGTDVVCGTCTVDPQIGCSSDARCIAETAGVCDGSTLFPNNCALPFNASCVPGGGGSDDGECTPTQNDRYCDGSASSGGDPVILCGNNADCTALDAYCPSSDCGQCTVTKPRECFLDPILSTGAAAGPFQADLRSIYCDPGSFSAAHNAGFGLPGPARLVADFELTPRCGECAVSASTPCAADEDCGASGPCLPNSKVWAPPIGSNCP